MVFFTCSHCGESVKKPAVSKHYQTKCKKKDPFLTCVDCLKDFKGNEYEAHTKCLTEEEKYSAKGHVPKASQNKGERKQQAWQECMQTVLKKTTLKPDERDFIRAISKYENVPRKKAKFLNFLTHAFKHYASKNDLIDRVWGEMESVFKEMSANNASAAEANKLQKQQQQQQQQQQKQPKQPKPEAKPAAKTTTKPATKGNIKAEDNAVKKEKKRKRPNEEEKGEATAEAGKGDDKQKKKKQKSTEEKKVEGNNDSVMLISDESETKPEKINRKRKADEDSQTESNNSVADESEPGKKKKKKKVDKPNENQANAAPTTKAEDDSKSKKKPKKSQNANPEAKTNADKAKGGAADANAVKKEKKPKKSENKENVAEKQPTAKAAAKPAGAKPAPGKPAANATNAKQPVKTAVKTPKSDQPGEGEKTAPKPKKGKTEPAPTPAADDKQEQFDWKATILQVLNSDGKNNRIQLQKLQKKVLKLHCQILNCENSEKKEKKFMRKLKEMPGVVMEKDFVVLKS